MIHNYWLVIVEQLGRRRNTSFIPDASNLNNDQVSWIKIHRLYDAPDSEIYPRVQCSAWLLGVVSPLGVFSKRMVVEDIVYLEY